MPGWEPAWAVCPGEVLLEEIEELGETMPAFAASCGLTVEQLDGILHHHMPVTSEIALGLQSGTGVSAGLWLNLEAMFRRALARGVAHDHEVPSS
jgi:addiction module HigA family antidote